MTALLKRLFVGESETRDIVVVLAAALLLWEAGVRIFHPSPLILPAPSMVVPVGRVNACGDFPESSGD